MKNLEGLNDEDNFEGNFLFHGKPVKIGKERSKLVKPFRQVSDPCSSS